MEADLIWLCHIPSVDGARGYSAGYTECSCTGYTERV